MQYVNAVMLPFSAGITRNDYGDVNKVTLSIEEFLFYVFHTFQLVVLRAINLKALGLLFTATTL